MPDDHQQAKRSRYFFDPLDCRNQEEPRHLIASKKDEQPAPASSSAYDFLSSFLTNAFFSRPPNINSYGHLLFLLDDVPESVKPVLGEYLLTVAKHYLAAYNDKLGGCTSTAMSPEAVTRQLTPEYRRTLATLAEANQAAAAAGNGHRRVRDLDGKITDGHERLARAAMIEEEEGFEEGEAAAEEAEDSSPEDDKVLMVLTEDEKIKAFYERIGYHFHVGGSGDGDDGGDGHQPKPSSAASSSTSSSSSSPAKTTTTAAEALNTVTNEEVQQLTTTSKAVDGGNKGGNGKCPTMTTTNTTSSLSSIFDSAEFVRFFGAHPKIGK